MYTFKHTDAQTHTSSHTILPVRWGGWSAQRSLFLLEESWDNCYRWLNSDTPMKQQHVLGKEKKELYLRRNLFTRTFNNKVSRNVLSCDVTFCRPLTLRRPYRSSKCKYCQFCQWVPSLYAVNINWLGKHLGVRWGMEGTYTTHGDLFFAVRV